MTRNEHRRLPLRTRALAVLLLAWWCGLAAGPPPPSSDWLIRRWGTQDGLPGTIVPVLLQSRSGRMWIGTLDGLAWSDGLTIHSIRPKDYPGAPETGVWSMLEAKDGTIWIGGHNGQIHAFRRGRFEDMTPKGIGSFNINLGETVDGDLWAGGSQGLWHWTGERWEQPQGPARTWFADIKSLATARQGGLWIGTRDQGAWHLTPSGALRPVEGPQGRLPHEISRILEDHQGRLWVGTRGHGMFQREGERLARCPDLPPDLLVESMALSAEGTLWVGSNLGIYRKAQGPAAPFEPGTFGRYARIPALVEDREGSLWVGTWQDGLINFRKATLDVLGAAQGLEGAVFSVSPRRLGGAWVSTNTGQVRILEGRRFRVPPGLPPSLPETIYAKDLLEDPEGQLWIGTRKGLLLLKGGRTHPVPLPGPAPSPFVRVLHQASDQALWVGTQQGLFRHHQGQWTRFTNEDGLTNGYILSIQSDPEGRVLVGTNGGGLCLYHKGRFTALRKETGLPSDVVFRGHRTPDGTWWFGSSGGIFLLRGDRVLDFSRAKDLLPTTVYQILGDAEGTLWGTSSRSIFRLYPEQALAFLDGREARLRSEAYDERDGLPNGGPTSVGRSLQVGNVLLVASVGGVVRVDPLRLKASIPQPKVEVLELRAGTAILMPGAPLQVPSRSDVEIRYTGHTSVGPERLGFRFLLEGYDAGWQLAGGRRSAFYTRLPPGTYRFRVMAGSGDGAWQEAPPVRIEVVPRWHERLPVRLALGGAGLALVWGVIRWRSSVHRRTAQELEALVADRTLDLRLAKDDLEQANQALESTVAERTQALREALQQALAADQAKSLFLARMSHEFRTPLNHMLLYTELIRQEWPPGAPRPDGDFRNIQASGKALEALLSDLLDFAELSSGTLTLRVAPFSPEALLRELETRFGPEARAKGLTLCYQSGPLPPALVGDAARCRQVLRDLVGNAVKFTPKGRVQVEAQWLGERLRITVADTGPGLPFERRNRPFEALEPGDGSLTRRHPGSGLGLALAHGLVTLMGGTLAWADHEGGGTVFTVELPLALP